MLGVRLLGGRLLGVRLIRVRLLGGCGRMLVPLVGRLGGRVELRALSGVPGLPRR